jgi:hypothetical protein
LFSASSRPTATFSGPRHRGQARRGSPAMRHARCVLFFTAAHTTTYSAFLCSSCM